MHLSMGFPCKHKENVLITQSFDAIVLCCKYKQNQKMEIVYASILI